MTQKVWNIPGPVSIPEELTQAGYPSLLAAVLSARGIRTAREAAAFFDGEEKAPEDPYLLADMDRAVSRIRLALDRSETAVVYGDYDVDGITSTCLLTEFLRSIGLSVEYYIPDRLEEGYGLNTGAIERLRDRGVSLIITVDCGVTAVEETEYARALGMDMIITDHHECREILPRACAVVNPKRPDSRFSGTELAGVGVAFALACALSGDPEGLLDVYADLVAVGTIADVMPLVGENRRIVKAGLEKLRRDPRPGFAALMEEAGVQRDRLTAASVGFSLAPRINAAGRLGRVQRAAALILERDPQRAAALAEGLCAMNRERQQLEADIWADAERMLSGEKPETPIVLAGQGWHQGVIGIVASRLTEAYSVPAIMISLDGALGKGSCRSYGGFNLFDALSACEGLLEGFGGHALAAGLNIKKENIDALREALGAYYLAHPPLYEEGINPDVLIHRGDMLSMDCVASLEQLEPCGTGNPRPSFCMTDCALNTVTPIGGGKHVSLRLGKFRQNWECVWFGRRAEELGIGAGASVDVVFSPQISEFRGRRSVQLVIQAMRRHDPGERFRALLSGRQDRRLTIDRRELGLIWRALERQCPLETELQALGDIEPRLNPAKIALGLRVFSELSLAEAELELDGPGIAIRLMDRGGKADLMDSPAWRAHQRREGGAD